jgi:hypothetical protein
MSHTPEDNLGRRRYLLLRDKAVEQALERIRRSPDARWDTLSKEEHAGLKDALAGIWETCGHEHWDQYCFSTLTKTEILALIALIADMRERHHQTFECHKAIETILHPGERNHSRH